MIPLAIKFYKVQAGKIYLNIEASMVDVNLMNLRRWRGSREMDVVPPLMRISVV